MIEASRKLAVFIANYPDTPTGGQTYEVIDVELEESDGEKEELRANRAQSVAVRSATLSTLRQEFERAVAAGFRFRWFIHHGAATRTNRRGAGGAPKYDNQDRADHYHITITK